MQHVGSQNTAKTGKTSRKMSLSHPLLCACPKVLRAGTTPILEKNAPRMEEQMKIFHFGFPSIPGIAPGVAPRIVAVVLLKSWDAIPRMEFRIPRTEFSSENGLFPQSVFFSSEIGVVPRLLTNVSQNEDSRSASLILAGTVRDLDGRDRSIFIVEALARVIAAIGIAGVHISPRNTEISRHRPCVRCAAI